LSAGTGEKLRPAAQTEPEKRWGWGMERDGLRTGRGQMQIEKEGIGD